MGNMIKYSINIDGIFLTTMFKNMSKLFRQNVKIKAKLSCFLSKLRTKKVLEIDGNRVDLKVPRSLLFGSINVHNVDLSLHVIFIDSNQTDSPWDFWNSENGSMLSKEFGVCWNTSLDQRIQKIRRTQILSEALKTQIERLGNFTRKRKKKILVKS
eukprot:Sdes_comp16828_c0_seq1m6075